MSKIELNGFTENQKSAITFVDNNALVTASAGSGKTSVLVTRICYILQEKLANLDEILVVTFTNLASLEMKQRVKRDLEILIKTNPEFTSQLDLLSTADISTLHKFCQKVIKEYFYETATDPNFRILEENESNYLINEAINQAMQEQVDNNNVDFINLVKLFNEKRKDVDFKNICIKVYNYLKSKQNYKDFCKNILKTTYNTNLNENSAIQYLNKYIDEMLTYFKHRLSVFMREASQIDFDKIKNYIGESLNFIALLENKTFEERYKFLGSDFVFAKMSLPKLTAEQEILKEEFKNIREQFKQELINLKEIIVDYNSQLITEKMNNANCVITTLLEFIFSMDQIYSEKKSKVNGLDFNDLEQKCLKTLENENIQKAISGKYKFIFIDEYQDTNEIQEAIVQKISNGHNMFMVGDIKQSIYLFRECRPQIFINKFNKYTHSEAEGKVVSLNKNFRSDKRILDFANYIFSNIMKNETSSVDYEKDAKFQFGGKFIASEDNSYPVVNIKIINKNTEKENVTTQDTYDLFSASKVKDESSSIINEVNLIAREIKELLNNKIYDSKTNSYRNIKLSDIAILSRKKSLVIRNIVNQLKEQGINASASYAVNIFDYYENKLIINYLSLINNFNNDIALASVLTSFMYGFSYNDLMQIKNNSTKGFLHQQIKEYLANEKQDKILNVLNKLKKDIEKYKTMLNFNKMSKVLDNIINDFYFEEHFLSLENSETHLKNIELLKQNVASFNDLSLTEYLNYINEFGKNKESEISISSGEDCVSVMTIHASKGLEFPVVFLINANKDFSKEGLNNKLITNQDLGFGIKTYNYYADIEENNIIRNIIKLKNIQEQKQEEMRLLYVALTRAKNHLIIVGTTDVSKISTISYGYEIMNATSYLKWIVGSFEERAFNIIKNGGKKTELTLDGGTASVEIIDTNYQEDNVVPTRKSYQRDINTSKFADEYIFAKQKDNPLLLKNTVTAIMNQEDNYNIKDFKYNIANKDSDEDFLLIGNLYHLVMEKIDIFKIDSANDVKEFLNQLVESNQINNNEKELINIEKIYKSCLFLRQIINTNDVAIKEKQFMCYLPANKLVSTEFTNKVLIQGVVDLMIIKNDEIILLDYKTTKASKPEMLITKYATQLDLYAKAVENFYNKKVTKKYIYSFYFDNAIIV